MLSTKLSIVYSNMPGPKETWYLDGRKMNYQVGLLPALGEMLCGLFMCTTGNNLKWGLITDKHYIQNPDLFAEILDRRISEVSYGKVINLQIMPTEECLQA